MRIQYFFLSVIVSLLLLGCARDKEIMVETPTTQTTKRVHTQEELKKTGQSQTGAALEKVDAAVQTTEHR